ncbi:hypothetical protein C0991_000704 [Blastosporella zonata]|nr:hypothetical protein C0991_000704 [Blastosporella zonata]
MLPALQTLYINSSAILVFTWDDMGSTLRASFLRLFALPTFKRIVLRSVKIPSTAFLSSPHLSDLSVLKSSIDLSTDSPLLSVPSSSQSRPKLDSLTFNASTFTDFAALSSTLNLAYLKKLDIEADGRDPTILASILGLCQPSLVNLILRIPELNMDSQFPFPSLPPNIQFLTVSIYSQDPDTKWSEERLAPFMWAIRALENLDCKSHLEAVTFEIIYHDVDALACASLWDDMDGVLAVQSSFNRLRCVALRLLESFVYGMSTTAQNREWEAVMRDRLPGLSSRELLKVGYPERRRP